MISVILFELNNLSLILLNPFSLIFFGGLTFTILDVIAVFVVVAVVVAVVIVSTFFSLLFLYS